jgi:hypothetical protein
VHRADQHAAAASTRVAQCANDNGAASIAT